MTFFAFLAVGVAFAVGAAWGTYLTLDHLDADAVDLDARLAVLLDDKGGRRQ